MMHTLRMKWFPPWSQSTLWWSIQCPKDPEFSEKSLTRPLHSCYTALATVCIEFQTSGQFGQCQQSHHLCMITKQQTGGNSHHPPHCSEHRVHKAQLKAMEIAGSRKLCSKWFWTAWCFLTDNTKLLSVQTHFTQCTFRISTVECLLCKATEKQLITIYAGGLGFLTSLSQISIFRDSISCHWSHAFADNYELKTLENIKTSY